MHDPPDDNVEFVEKHIQVLQQIRSMARSNSRRSAKMMVSSATASHPPAVYSVGCEVLVRRFSSKSKIKAWERSFEKAV